MKCIMIVGAKSEVALQERIPTVYFPSLVRIEGNTRFRAGWTGAPGFSYIRGKAGCDLS
ncbi:MAG: hypothetical protein ACYCYP_04105 [Leptospirales bacterium]